MRRLAGVPEHLDGELGAASTLEGNLRDLRRINRLFGGTRLSTGAIRRLAASGPAVRILDVGTGAADIPIALLRQSGPWRPVAVTAVDSRPEVLEAARRLTPGLRRASDLVLEVADGRRLPYPDRAFDVAHASLVLHHLDRPDAVAFLRELARVSATGVVVNDLARSRLAWIAAWLVLHGMTRNPWTLHDGPLSVRRAWTPREARGLLAEAGMQPIATLTGLFAHRWAIAAVRT